MAMPRPNPANPNLRSFRRALRIRAPNRHSCKIGDLNLSQDIIFNPGPGRMRIYASLPPDIRFKQRTGGGLSEFVGLLYVISDAYVVCEHVATSSARQAWPCTVRVHDIVHVEQTTR